MKEGKDNRNRKERKREAFGGNGERKREKRKANKEEGRLNGRMAGKLLRRKRRLLWLATTRGQCSTG